MDYSSKEMMAIAAARQINNSDIVFCGTGISMLAAMAAKNINAPKSIIFFETGAIDSKLEDLPLAPRIPTIFFAVNLFCIKEKESRSPYRYSSPLLFRWQPI